MPHVWFEPQGRRLSTLDLIDGRWIMLSAAAGGAWSQAAATAAERLGVNLAVYQIGASGDLLDVDGRWSARLGIESGGAVLVRPDGFVAWRAKTPVADPSWRLVEVMASILNSVRVGKWE